MRLEVETALRRPDVTVIPCSSRARGCPTPDDLPGALRTLARRNALELSDLRWRYDVGRCWTPSPACSSPRPRPAAPVRSLGWLQVLEGTLIAALLAGFLLMRFENISSPEGTNADRIETTTVRNALVRGIVGLVLAGWLAWRRGDRAAVPRALALGALLGALGAALGSQLFARLTFQDDQPSADVLHAVSVCSLALIGAALGLALALTWRSRRALAALAVGAAAAALMRLLLVFALAAPALPNHARAVHADRAAAAQAAAIAAAVLALLIFGVRARSGDSTTRRGPPARQCSDSPRASIATNLSIRRARVSGRFASCTR